MLQVYLLLNSAFCIVFALWCLIKPTETANYLGYNFLNNSGKIEYLTVYAGIEMGFAFFLATAAFVPNIKLSGLVFCVCIYFGSMLIRTSSALLYGNVSKVTYMVGGLEYILGIWGAILLFRYLIQIKTDI